MASFTFSAPRAFPNGTSVGAYPASNWPTAQLPPEWGVAAVGAATESQTVASSVASFVALTAGTSYYMAASVGGQWRYVRVNVPAAPVITGGGVKEWATGTAYYTGNVVEHSSQLYEAVDDHTAGATFAGDSAHWTQLALPTVQRLLSYGIAGTLTTATGAQRIRFPFAAVIESVAITANTAPTGATILVDANKNGTTIFTTQANRPSIAISGNASTDKVPDVTAFAIGDYLTFDVDQVGSTIAGADLVVTVTYH